MEGVHRHRPDVVLLDLRMPGVDGLAVLREVGGRPGAPAVAMLTTFDTDEFIAQALALGAAGFLLKDTEPNSSSTPYGCWPPAAACCPRR